MSNISIYINRSGSSSAFSSASSRQKSASHLALHASKALNRMRHESQRRGKKYDTTRRETAPVEAYSSGELTEIDKYDMNDLESPKFVDSTSRYEPFASPKSRKS
eukprot:10672010-Ditylum_brightwellii.AAC.1